MSKINVVLYEPQIPQNNSNIARIYLVGKLDFYLSIKYAKRPGLDYWECIDIHKFDNMEDLYSAFPNSNFYYLSTKSKKVYTGIKFNDGDFLVFGPETRGLPEQYVKDKNAIRLPMNEGQRSFNLSFSVAITVYEIIRQNRI